MKTIFTEKDLAFKSPDQVELLELGLSYLEPGKPGQRNELSKMIQKSKNEGLQQGKKSRFTAAYDKKRGEYILFIRDQYEPACQLAMLFELMTESATCGDGEEELQIRSSQIKTYLAEVEKNEELDLSEECSHLINYTGQFLKTMELYQDEEELSQEELERLSDRIDLSFYKPISDIIESILERLISGNMPIDLDLGDFPLPE